MVQLKVRIITKEGKIYEADKENTSQNTLKQSLGRDAINLQKLGINGVDPGSEIEYFYTLKRLPVANAYTFLTRTFLGDANSFVYGTEIFQGNTKTKEANFTLTCPYYIVFKIKNYNGFPKIQQTSNGNITIYTAGIKDIPAMVNEKFSTPMANCLKVAYNFEICNKAAFQYENN